MKDVLSSPETVIMDEGAEVARILNRNLGLALAVRVRETGMRRSLVVAQEAQNWLGLRSNEHVSERLLGASWPEHWREQSSVICNPVGLTREGHAELLQNPPVGYGEVKALVDYLSENETLLESMRKIAGVALSETWAIFDAPTQQ